MRRISEIGLKRKLTKILSGEVKCKVGNKEFYIRSPSLSQIYESEVIYQEYC